MLLAMPVITLEFLAMKAELSKSATPILKEKEKHRNDINKPAIVGVFAFRRRGESGYRVIDVFLMKNDEDEDIRGRMMMNVEKSWLRRQ